MSVENVEERKELFRKFAGTAIENSHNSIKQVWVALFAGGTFALIKSFDELMGCAGFFERPGTCNGFLQKVHDCPSDRGYLLLLLFTLYFVYILTFYRFYVGNVRVFDMRYIEVGKFIGLLADKQENPEEKDITYRGFFKYIDKNSRMESIYLIFKTLVIISLTIEINAPKNFLIIYMVMLLSDVGWIHIATASSRPYFSTLFFETMKLPPGSHDMMFPSRAMRVWKVNNFVCGFILLAIILLVWSDKLSFVLPNTIFIILGAAVTLANCVWDLMFTWQFYNPNFADVYGLLLQSHSGNGSLDSERESAP